MVSKNFTPDTALRRHPAPPRIGSLCCAAWLFIVVTSPNPVHAHSDLHEQSAMLTKRIAEAPANAEQRKTEAIEELETRSRAGIERLGERGAKASDRSGSTSPGSEK